MIREEDTLIARHPIAQVVLMVNADKRQISLIPLLLKLSILSLQKCYMKTIPLNSIRDHLKRYSQFLRAAALLLVAKQRRSLFDI